MWWWESTSTGTILIALCLCLHICNQSTIFLITLYCPLSAMFSPSPPSLFSITHSFSDCLTIIWYSISFFSSSPLLPLFTSISPPISSSPSLCLPLQPIVSSPSLSSLCHFHSSSNVISTPERLYFPNQYLLLCQHTFTLLHSEYVTHQATSWVRNEA